MAPIPPTLGNAPAEPGRSSTTKAVLIYDGDCAACRKQALWLMRLALSRAELEILPYRSGPRRARFPDLDAATCARAMQLALPDGRIVDGVDAAPELLSRIATWRWLPAALRSVHARAPARRVYGWMARRRMGLVCPRAGGRTAA